MLFFLVKTYSCMIGNLDHFSFCRRSRSTDCHEDRPNDFYVCLHIMQICDSELSLTFLPLSGQEYIGCISNTIFVVGLLLE